VSDRRNPELERAFIDCYAKVKGKPTPPFSIQFYPYSSLRHTIRLRSGQVLIRISDILCEAPEEVLGALISILVHRLYRRRTPSDLIDTYSRYANSDEIRRKSRDVRGRRGKKQLGPARGKNFDLEILFRGVNLEYFGNQVQISQLGWSLIRSKRVLGHYDPAHRTIIVSRLLDHPLVPQYVVEYVLYHEMLHVIFDDENRNGQSRVHHRSFREAERRFSRYAAAQAFIRTEL